MKYLAEKDYIIKHMRLAHDKFIALKPQSVEQKGEFDLVTDIDLKIEEYLIDAIKAQYPNDRILSEEFHSGQKITGRTWTIDPIDGTCNLAHSMKLYGVQCALFEDSQIVMSALIIPVYDEEYYAIKGGGAYLNGNKISVSSDCQLNNAIASFGDYTHKAPQNALMQHRAIYHLYQEIAKIRMFGSACIDFCYVASGKTDATVVMTNNLWDIAPGILLCSEAGAVITNPCGEKYSFDDIAVVASATAPLSKLIASAFNKAEKRG